VIGRPAGQCPGSGDEEERAERHVHDEHPAPAQQPGQQAADHAAQRSAGRRGGGEQAQSLRLGAWLAEAGRHQAQGGRHQDRAPEPLDEAGRHDMPPLLRQPGGEAGEGEQQESAHEGRLAPPQVAEPSAEQQEAREGQRVAAHHPLEPGGREAEALLQRGQRHVDDPDVEDADELRRARHGQEDARPARRCRDRPRRGHGGRHQRNVSSNSS
jgi:hypothetical protein